MWAKTCDKLKTNQSQSKTDFVVLMNASIRWLQQKALEDFAQRHKKCPHNTCIVIGSDFMSTQVVLKSPQIMLNTHMCRHSSRLDILYVLQWINRKDCTAGARSVILKGLYISVPCYFTVSPIFPIISKLFLSSFSEKSFWACSNLQPMV